MVNLNKLKTNIAKSINNWNNRTRRSYLAEFLLEKGYEVHGLKEDQAVLILKELIIFTKILIK